MHLILLFLIYFAYLRLLSPLLLRKLTLDSDRDSIGYFSDTEMAAFALMVLYKNDDSAVGFSKEEVDAITQKYVGATIQNYNNQKSYVVPETGNIETTGWGMGNPLLMVLKELEIDADGVCTGIFYRFTTGYFGIEPTVKPNLLQGFFDGYEHGPPFLTTIVFEEKTDENGEMYLRYHDIKSEGEATPPYTVYQG